MRDWRHPHLHGKSTTSSAHALSVEEEQRYNESLREVVHYTRDGWWCCDCGMRLTIEPAVPFLPETAVVVLNGDARAAWVTTTRRPNCQKW